MPFSGYIGSSSFLMQVKEVIQDLKRANPNLIYGLYAAQLIYITRAFIALFAIYTVIISNISTTVVDHTVYCTCRFLLCFNLLEFLCA